MREIEFRGKREDDWEWVYGGILHYGNSAGEHAYIIAAGLLPQYTKVDPDTVGQYTGLKDRDGVKIFEGDIINLFGWGQGVVIFSNGNYMAHNRLRYILHFEDETYHDQLIGIYTKEVIGNIHDNPELLEK